MASGRQHYHFLDFCRGVAALVVLVYHLGATLGGPAIFGAGFVAVDFFFILSGFVIAHAYEQRLNDGMPLARFFRARIIRLYPMAALGVLTGLAALAAGEVLDEAGAGFDIGALVNLLLLPQLLSPPGSDGTLFPLDGALWSLFFELIMNGLFAAVLVRLGNRALWVVAALGAVLTIAVALAVGSFNIGWNVGTFAGGFGRALFGFTIGMLIFRHRGRFPRGFAGASLLVLAVLLLLPLVGDHNLIMSGVAIFIAFPAIVALGTAVRWQGVDRLQAMFGNLSYPLYALHLPVMAIVVPLIRLIPGGVSPALLQGVAGAVVLAAAALAYRFIDVPLRAWLAGLLAGGAKPSRQPSGALQGDFISWSMSRR